MKLKVLQEELARVAADVLVMAVPEGAEASALDLPAGMAAMVGEALAGGDFRADFGETAIFYTSGQLAARKLMLLGLGRLEKLDGLRLRRAAGIGARAARRSGATVVAFAVPALANLPTEQAAQFLVEGVYHGLYRFETLKSDGKERPNVQALIVTGDARVATGAETGRIIAEGVNLARSLNFLPGNYLTATRLGERAREICAEVGIECEVYDRLGCADLGLGLLLSVNQGSKEEPRFVVMRYSGAGGTGPWLGIVGKGVTFDTGGISIKPGESMWNMKYDMSGAGAVLGAVQAVGRLKPACDVMFIISATDNMPDGGAYKPGDVIRGISGKTVEIHSTDAEGRLVLSDGLAYAARQGCTRLLTASTLTGATNIALGPQRFAIVSNDDAWEQELFRAAEEAGERGWPLPHDEEYYDLIKSPIADMINGTTGRAAGTIAGGIFLMKHVGDTPCVHMDIAAQAWRTAEDKYEDLGATGVGVRTFVRAAQRFSEGSK